MDPDGTNQVNLTNDAAVQRSPAWSPDGSTLAFIEGGQIWKMLVDGSGRTKLSDGTTTDMDPSWSPDGQKILFASCCPPGHDFTLETMNADGTGRTVVGDFLDEVFDTDWASDGSRAWVEFSDCSGLISVVTSTFGLLFGPCGDYPMSQNPSWSPDAQRVAYVVEDCTLCDHDSVYTIKRDGTDPQQLTSPPTNERDGIPKWSPDGSKLAFARGGSYRIKLMNPDGSGITDVTDGTDPDWQPIPINSYPRPRGATPLRLSLVPAYQQCTSPNSTHGAPLADGSCAPPALSSSQLTVGTPDANGKRTTMDAYIELKTVLGPPTPADDADVEVTVHADNVFTKDLSDYAGSLRANLPVRITDKSNTPAPGGPGAATTVPFLFGFDVPCTPDPDETVGSDCTLATTADTLYPGAILEGRRAIWQMGRGRLDDAGPDGDPDTTADNTVFAVQGVFVP